MGVFSEDFRVEDGQILKDVLSSQVFTPCGRYGIGLPMDYGIGGISSRITLPVVDYFYKKLNDYRYETTSYIECDFIYCLDSTTLVSIRAQPRRIEQKVWHLNHQMKTVEFVSKRYYRHKIKRPKSLAIHKRCRKDLAFQFNEKTYNIWISAEPIDLGHHLVFLIPRNPNSQENLKLFYVDLETLPDTDDSVAVHYNLWENGTPCIAPIVVRSCLWFPVAINEKQIVGLWMVVCTEHLEDMIDAKEIDIGNLREMQNIAYAYTAQELKRKNIEENYPALELDNFTGQMHTIFWEKSKEPGPLAYKRVQLLSCSGKITLHHIDVPINKMTAVTIHPSGWLLMWIQDSTGVKSVIRRGMPTETIPTLFEIVKKKLIMQDFADMQSIPGYDRILFK